MKKNPATRLAALMTAATLALVMALTAIPFSALPRFAAKAEVTPAWTVPEGYNVHDYTKCVTFLEQTDENGVKNGEKISENYDPNDPKTWGLRAEIEDFCFHWTTVNGEQRMREINVELWNLCGRLDISGCTALLSLNCEGNNLTKLDVTGCTALENLYCYNNNLTELDVSGCTALWELNCSNNMITELHLPDGYFSYVNCLNNNLTELDMSHCFLHFDRIMAEGNGYIGYYYEWYEGDEEPIMLAMISAKPRNGASFEGFYNESGVLVAAGEWNDDHQSYIYEFEHSGSNHFGTITARFSGGVTPGDVDGNGSVSVADAITALRLAMGLLDGNGMNNDAADMDGNGSITIADAIVILRTAMGLA